MVKWGRDTAQLSGVDAQRAMLDELMGLNRNEDNPDAVVEDYHDERICRHFLLGCCPHDVLSKTKVDLGPCDLQHDQEMKAQFEEKKTEDEEWEYMMDLERKIKNLLQEVEKKIARGQRRLEGEGGGGGGGGDRGDRGGGGGVDRGGGGGGGPGESKPVDIANSSEVLKLQAEIEDTMAQAEAKGEEGEVDEAEELMKKVEELKLQKAEVQSKLVAEAVAKGMDVSAAAAGGNPGGPSSGLNDGGGRPAGGGGRFQEDNQKLRVCEVCGAFLSVSDNDRRLADHFGGKLHLGYVQMRDKLKEINDIRQKRREARGGGGGGEGRDRSRDRGRGGRDRSRDRSRDRGGSSRRHHDDKYRRSRSRDRDRHRRDRSRDRDYRRGDRDRRRY